jgi:thiosulfate reductase cytochrome b subunit
VTYRGLTFGGLLEAIAIGAIFALLTLLPWQSVVGLILVALALGFLRLHLKGERHRRSVERAERRAELQRDLIRAERDRSEALRYHGGVIR